MATCRKVTGRATWEDNLSRAGSVRCQSDRDATHFSGLCRGVDFNTMYLCMLSKITLQIISRLRNEYHFIY